MFQEPLFSCWCLLFIRGEKQKVTKEIQGKIDKNMARIKEAQRMRLDKEIDMRDYLEIKNIYEPAIKDLTQKQTELAESDEQLPKYAEESGSLLNDFLITT